MNTIEHRYDVNGNEPAIVGTECLAFYLMQHQVGDSIESPANSAYFKFPAGWFSFCFDGSTIFWRTSEQPGEPVNSDLASMLVLVNLSEFSGVVGSILSAVEYWGTESEVGANFHFVSGKVLAFHHDSAADVTRCKC